MVQIEIGISDGKAMVTVNGRLNMSNAMAFEQEVLPVAQQCTDITLDFAGVEFISSAGIRVLLTLYRAVSPKGGAVTIVNPCEQVRDILKETEFDELFNL